MSEVINVEDVEVGNTTMRGGTTLAGCLSPLLTSMKLYGMYFRCRTNVGDKSTTEKSRVKWNAYVIYAMVVVILLWINALRMFSVFTKILILTRCWSLLRL